MNLIRLPLLILLLFLTPAKAAEPISLEVTPRTYTVAGGMVKGDIEIMLVENGSSQKIEIPNIAKMTFTVTIYDTQGIVQFADDDYFEIKSQIYVFKDGGYVLASEPSQIVRANFPAAMEAGSLDNVVYSFLVVPSLDKT